MEYKVTIIAGVFLQVLWESKMVSGIRFRIPEILFERGITDPVQLAAGANIAYGTAYTLVRKREKASQQRRIDLDILENLCRFLEIAPGEALEWVESVAE